MKKVKHIGRHGMTSTQLQFHASPAEVAEWIKVAVDKMELNVVRVSNSPFRVEPVPVDRLKFYVCEVAAHLKVEFALSKGSFDLQAATQLEFFDRNEGCIFLSVGGLSAAGLNESFIGCKSRSEKHITLAKKVLTIFKSKMRAGVIARNPVTGENARYPSHWLSPEARELENSGVSLLALGGLVLLSPLP